MVISWKRDHLSFFQQIMELGIMALTEKDSLCDGDIVSQKWSEAKKMPIYKALFFGESFLSLNTKQLP